MFVSWLNPSKKAGVFRSHVPKQKQGFFIFGAMGALAFWYSPIHLHLRRVF